MTSSIIITLALLPCAASATDYTWKGNVKAWDAVDNGGQTWWHDGAAYGSDFATVNRTGNRLTVDGTAPGELLTSTNACNAALYIAPSGLLRIMGNHTASNLHMNGGMIVGWYYTVERVLNGSLQ